jgi:hypothetical protein
MATWPVRGHTPATHVINQAQAQALHVSRFRRRGGSPQRTEVVASASHQRD